MNFSLKLFKELYYKRALNFTPEALWVLIGQLGSAIGGLIAVKLLSNLLSQTEFGKFALVNTLISFVGTYLFGPFGQGLMRFWSIGNNRGNLDVFYRISNRLAMYISMLAVIFTLLFTLILFVTGYIEWSILFLLALLLGVTSGVIGMRTSVWDAMRQRRKTALVNICSNFLKPALAALVIFLTIRTASVVVVSYLLGTILILFLAERVYARDTGITLADYSLIKTDGILRHSLTKEIILYSWPFAVWATFGWIHLFCDRWIIKALFGLEVVGAFAVVSQLANYPLSFGSGFLCNLLTPVAFQRAGKLTDGLLVNSAVRILKAMTALYTIGLVVVIVFFFFFHRQLILLVSNQAFVKYSYLLPGLTLSWGLFYLGQVLTVFGLLYNKSQVYIYPKIAASLVALAGVFYFASKLGIEGVVWGIGLANLVYAVWCAVIFIDLKSKRIVISNN